jgi:hypothetical protein
LLWRNRGDAFGKERKLHLRHGISPNR